MLKYITRIGIKPYNRYYSTVPLNIYKNHSVINPDIYDKNNPKNISDRNEITVYIKGFLSKGESPASFKEWLKTHKKIPDWCNFAKGWYWDCGTHTFPFPPITALYTWLKGIQIFRLNPWAIAATATADISIMTAATVMQYFKAEKNTVKLAGDLALNLEELTNNYENVRIVAHSLGCKLLLNALKEIPPEKYPKTIHLFAPAFIESEYNDILSNFGKSSKMYIYYCKNDFMLATLLYYIEGNHPVGAVGLKTKYNNIKSIDVEEHFKDSWFVHKNYKSLFNNFIANEKLEIKHNENEIIPDFKHEDITERIEHDKQKKMKQIEEYYEKLIKDPNCIMNRECQDHPEYIEYMKFVEYMESLNKEKQ
jgi:hypothetical protein